MVQDFTLRQTVEASIQEGSNVEQAVDAAISQLCQVFQGMDDAYMQERADDVKDIGGRLLASLQNRSASKFAGLKVPSVIVAKDLFPSDTALLDKALVLGFITEEGGVTSHVSIMSKSLGIPALVGAKGILAAVKEGDVLAFDAEGGEILINPDAEASERYQKAQARFLEEGDALLADAAKPVTTTDGHTVKVYANVGSLEDIEAGLRFQLDGVGLFRSEFLFMGNDHFPSEEEQFQSYKAAVESLGKEMIIRTLDIGGDKQLSYFDFKPEENPFLGWRAIRMCLDMPEIFKTQLRAILRASAFGPLRIMLPMIISISELERSKALIESCKEELKAEGIAFDPEIPVGIMVETPALVFKADALAKRVDFFSIGTNDLTQYVLAVDRGNPEIKALYNSFHPAVLKAIALTIQAGKKAKIEVGMCGEFAGNKKATKLLLGLGLDEFSMAAADTLLIKAAIRKLNYEDAKAFAEEVLALDTAAEVSEKLGL